MTPEVPGTSPNLRSSPDPRALESLDAERLRAHQEDRLRALAAALGRSGFYRRKLGAAGVDPASIATLEGLFSLPLLVKDELLRAQAEHPPYGELLTRPLADYPYLHRTSGTSGRPLYWLDTAEDWATWMRSWGAVYRGAGVGRGDVVFCAFSFGPYVSHWTALGGARHAGARALPGAAATSRQRLETILEHGATVVVSTPTYALHLGEVAAEAGIDLPGSAVATTIHAGEPGASVPNVQARIETLWGARVFDHAGATEVGAWGFPCRAQPHGMHLNELEFVFEVIDPTTAEPVADGTRGELVVTTLGRHGMPVLRYRTGDLVVRDARPCPCGRTLARIPGGVLGRADDMMIVRGVNLYPSAIDDLLRGVAGVVEYQVEIRRRHGLDDLLVKVETAPETSWPEVEAALRQAFKERFDLRVELARAAPGSLPRYELKARRYRRRERGL